MKDEDWIRIQDRLPQDGKEVLVWSDRYGRTFATLCGQNKYGTFWKYHDDPMVTFNAPTNWAELPNKPNQQKS